MSAKAALFCSPALSEDVDSVLHACEIANIAATPYDADDFNAVSDLVSNLPDMDMVIVLANRGFVSAKNAVSQIHWATIYNPGVRLSWLCQDVFDDFPDLAAYANLSLPWPLDFGTNEDIHHFLMLEVLESKFGRGPRHRNLAPKGP
jgi:hypothetical protein